MSSLLRPQPEAHPDPKFQPEVDNQLAENSLNPAHHPAPKNQTGSTEIQSEQKHPADILSPESGHSLEPSENTIKAPESSDISANDDKTQATHTTSAATVSQPKAGSAQETRPNGSATKSDQPKAPSSAKKSSNATAGDTKLNADARPNKPSLLSRFFRKLIPCIPSSPDEDSAVVGEETKRTGPAETSPPIREKAPVRLAEKPSSVPSTRPLASPKDRLPPPASDDTTKHVPPPLALVSPAASPDAEVIVPPTPTNALLPESETAGMTSGAVVPPGSTGGSSPPGSSHSRHSNVPTANGADDESEAASSYTDEEEAEVQDHFDEIEDEEDRLILNGGAGIPIGPDGIPRPLLPPIAPQHAGRKCLVLDLDETLVHSSFKSIQQADYVVPVEIEYHWHNVYVIKRPGVDNFLKKMGEIYEVVVFTASLSKYADPVLDKLDIHQVVSHRLFRESCYNHKGNYVKDLSQLGRPIGDTIILDNSPASYIFHPNNAVPVSSWFNDPHDTELTDLVPFLADLSTVDDVRGILDGAR